MFSAKPHPNKGRKLSPESVERIRLGHIGLKHSEETKAKISKAHIGKVVSDEQKKRQKNTVLKQFSNGRKAPSYWLGKKLSEEHKKKIGENSNAPKGDKHPSWKGGITPARIVIRTCSTYKKWRRSVFERDNYTCVWCGAKNGNGKAIVLNADHIKEVRLFPELIFDLSNGRTLCVGCHKIRHKK